MLSLCIIQQVHLFERSREGFWDVNENLNEWFNKNGKNDMGMEWTEAIWKWQSVSCHSVTWQIEIFHVMREYSLFEFFVVVIFSQFTFVLKNSCSVHDMRGSTSIIHSKGKWYFLVLFFSKSSKLQWSKAFLCIYRYWIDFCRLSIAEIGNWVVFSVSITNAIFIQGFHFLCSLFLSHILFTCLRILKIFVTWPDATSVRVHFFPLKQN